jgi:hypothetical protein
MSGSPAGTVASTASLTHVPVQSDTNDPHSPRLAGGEGASAIQGGTVGDKIEDIQNDWEHDPANPRNWAPARKWITISLVS